MPEGILIGGGGHNFWGDAPRGKFKPFLQNIVDEMNSAGKQVYIVSENPVFPWQPRDFIHRPFSFNSQETHSVLLKDDVYKHQKEYLDMLAEIKGAEIINGMDALCPNGECPMFDINGMPLYFDDDHLSVYGSHYLVKNLLEPYLIDIAGQSEQ